MYISDELFIPHPTAKQLQRILSQDWIRSWDRWRSIKEALDKCQTEETRRWTSQHVVFDITSVSLTHMVVSFPSDAERRIQVIREGVLFGDSEGFDYDCLSDSLLQLLLHNKMFKHPSVDVNVSTWRREACEAVRAHLCSHEDERLWPLQRDQNNRVREVYSEQHNRVYLKHSSHSAAIIQLCFKYAASDDVNVSRGVRMIIHSRFDSVDLRDDSREGNAMIMYCCASASMHQADLRM